MTKYREILRLSDLGISQANIAYSCNVSKKTVCKVLKAAREKDISWPLDESQTDLALAKLLFPENSNGYVSTKRMPDYEYIRKELLKTVFQKNFYGLNTWRNAVRMVMNL